MPGSMVGTIGAIWRYPVKSMQGEALDAAPLGERGLLGDRAYALLERATGHVASAKHPRKWAALLQCRAAYVAPPQPDGPLPPVRITLPDGSLTRSDDPDVDDVLSHLVGQPVTLLARPPREPTREANRAPLDAPAGQEAIQAEPLALAAPPGTFFDYAPLHVLTSATLRRLRALYPAGVFEARRFRPNILVDTGDEQGFIENGWSGHDIILSERVALRVIDPCPRCVVTTLPQGELPHDPRILRAVAHNEAHGVTLAPGHVFAAVAGVYAQALRDGMIQAGDPVRFEP